MQFEISLKHLITGWNIVKHIGKGRGVEMNASSDTVELIASDEDGLATVRFKIPHADITQAGRGKVPAQQMSHLWKVLPGARIRVACDNTGGFSFTDGRHRFVFPAATHIAWPSPKALELTTAPRILWLEVSDFMLSAKKDHLVTPPLKGYSEPRQPSTFAVGRERAKVFMKTMRALPPRVSGWLRADAERICFEANDMLWVSVARLWDGRTEAADEQG